MQYDSVLEIYVSIIVHSFFLFQGIILEYEQGGLLKTKSIDLLDLKPE